MNRRKFLLGLLGTAVTVAVAPGFSLASEKLTEPEFDPILPKLPSGIELIEFGGQYIFPCYSASGGLSTQQLSYLAPVGVINKLNGTDLGRPPFDKKFEIKTAPNGMKWAVVQFSKLAEFGHGTTGAYLFAVKRQIEEAAAALAEQI